MKDAAAQARSLAAGLPELLLAAERLAHAAAAGAHGRRVSGAGESFWQFREFRQGDEARRIDWRRSAAAERVFLREREWDAPAGIALSLHDTPGMAFRSAERLPCKRNRAVLLLLALASLLLRAGERVALAGMTPPLTGTAALTRLAAALAAAPAESGAPRTARLEPKARRVVFGDFLRPDPVFHGPPGGAVLQILDPAECDFPYAGRIVFAGFAGEKEIEAVAAQGWAAAYRARLAGQRQAVGEAARRAGQIALFHRTDAGPATALAALAGALSERFSARPAGR